LNKDTEQKNKKCEFAHLVYSLLITTVLYMVCFVLQAPKLVNKTQNRECLITFEIS
jgi:hypothetical protein